MVLYLAVFDIGTQLWSGTVAAIALLLLGCIWLFGDTARWGIRTATPHSNCWPRTVCTMHVLLCSSI